jgi:tRNA A-37 threonylcarbamoyl transferase component Bud32
MAATIEADAASGLRAIHPAAVMAQPSSTSDDARQLQERLALFALVTGTLSALALVLVWGTFTLMDEPRSALTYVLHGATIVASTTTWLFCRRSPRGRRALVAVDLALTVTLTGCFAGVTACYAASFRPELVACISTILVTTSRAIMVPSAPRRTFIVSAIAWLPSFVAAYVVYRVPVLLPGSFATRSLLVPAELEIFTWGTIGLVLVSIASRVIFGLRREVREAQKLGQYTLLEKLGEGGMGQVFRAQHAMLRRPTAVKLLHSDRLAGVEDLARFEREVQLTAQLSHPNVVTVFDYGRTPDGVFYYAMELLEGLNLEDVIAESGPMSAARAVHVLSQVASALAEAHAVGLIHRDIKPANIILCARGSTLDVAKVVDFGLVKQLDASSVGKIRTASAIDEAADSTDAIDVSRTGTVLGTPMYLAPEAMTSPGSVDGRADVYALGAVAYFLLTGTVVFGGATVLEACRHHMTTKPEPPSERLRASSPDSAPIPDDLEAIVLQCLAKSPARRPASAKALLDALRSCASAGTWSEADARAAWDEARARPMAAHAKESVTSWTAKTIAVDLVR